jgi:hypothetical protein
VRQGAVWDARAYRRLGTGVFLLCMGMEALRVVVTGTWLPRDALSIVGFVVDVLFLAPLGLLYLSTARFWPQRQERPIEHTADAKRTSGVPILVGWVAILIAFAWAWVGSTVVSRHLEWGRYGFGPPGTPRGLDEITDETGIVFPEGARLIDGEIVESGPDEHVLAVLQMTEPGLKWFLGNQPDWSFEEWSDSPEGMYPILPQSVRARLSVGTWVLYAGGNRGGLDSCSIAVDMSRGEQRLVYVYWIAPPW